MRTDNPTIYVSDPAHQRGAWIDATQDPEDIRLEITDRVKTEEYTIFDYDGFGPVEIREYAPLDVVSRVAQGIKEHGNAFAHWVTDVLGSVDYLSEPSRFEDAYLGTWKDVEAYADSLIDDMGWYAVMEEHRIPIGYFDIKAFARDLVLGGDIAASEDGLEVHIFDPRI
ncbi:antirestriction protein ArdA [Fodinicola acaciae]|uniref:antirestriction protein ArdA n=1 Tax=Fodinicola acaciae TaxID=2681555 RepID=UPI0013D30BA6|nr:antirestriction protein ArdA [Fodinicola acaciae]